MNSEKKIKHLELIQGVINRMPRPNDVYHRLTRYADAD